MSFTGKRGENGVVVMLKAEALKKSFEPYADGTNDIELFEAGFNAGVEWLATQMCKSLELGFKETIDSYHNTDIAACGHATCPSRENCLRWIIGQRMENYHRFGEFKPKNGVCAYHIWTNEKLNDNEKD